MSWVLPAPGPAEDFTVRSLTTEDVDVWYHVYSTARHPTTATTFSRGWGDTRFAPIYQDKNDAVPVHTYYLASSRESVYMESVLHNVALSPPGLFEVDSLRHFHVAKVRLSGAVDFVSFHSKDLPRLGPQPGGLARAELIDSLTDCYPGTRAWSQAAYNQRPQAQAIGYGSRRDDSGRCLMLFEQRLPDPPFEVLEERGLAKSPYRDEVLALVRSLGLHEV